MIFRTIALAGSLGIAAPMAQAACAFDNETPVSSLTAGFEAWKAVTDAMAECGNVSASLDQEFREKQPEAFAANPALYQIGGVANSTIVPLLNAGTIRPLDDLVARIWRAAEAQPADQDRRADHGCRDDGQHAAPDGAAGHL